MARVALQDNLRQGLIQRALRHVVHKIVCRPFPWGEGISTSGALRVTASSTPITGVESHVSSPFFI